MKTKILFLSMMLMSLCFVACNSQQEEPGTDDPKTQTDPETEIDTDKPKKDVITVTPMQIAAPAEGGEYSLEIESEVKWSVSSSASWVTYSTATLTIGEYGGDAANKVEVKITREAGTIVEPELSKGGVLSGEFSVSADTKVHFSIGNLQYQASTKTWRFAENQYDFIGDNNKNISDTYDGWIDLFGWGIGSNPTVSSTEYSDYATFTDWGVNKISNGGNTANQWRTLAKDEWQYLYSGRTNAANLRSQAIVNNVHGYIFLPDSWSLPSGMSFTTDANDWTTNTYSASDWANMEQNGAVFLPAAGFRFGTYVNFVGSYGFYWSSTPYDTSYAYYLNFGSDDVNPQSNYDRYSGQSVRLVKDL